MKNKAIFFPRSIQLFADTDDDPLGGGDDKVRGSFQKRLDKLNGDAMALAWKLFEENYDERRKKQAALAEVEDLKKKVAPEGAVIITGNDAAAWNEVKELGLTPAQLKEKIEQAGEVGTLKRREAIREAAATEGYDSDVLHDLTKEKSLDIEIKEVEDKGQKRRVAYVTDANDQTIKSIPLSEYAEKHLAKYLPSLRAESTRQDATQYVHQTATGRAPATNLYQRIREEQKAKQEEQKKDAVIPLDSRLNMTPRAS